MNETRPDTNNERVIVADRPDYLLFGVFVFLWLMPLTWTGMTKKPVPFVGTYANDMYRVPALFTQRLQGSVVYYFQVQFEDGLYWIDIPKRDYSSIIMSGNRTRLDRMLQDSRRSPRGLKQRQRLAEYIKQQYEQRNPGSSKIESFRYLFVVFPVGEKMAQEKRGWRDWPIERIPENQLHELSLHYFDGRPAKDTFIDNLRKAVEARKKSKQ